MLYKQLNKKICAGILATDITGVTGNNGVYNIEAAKVSGSTGFRQYGNFDLSKGDVANLIYKAGKWRL